MTSTRELADKLSAIGACPESVQWACDYTDDATAWRECRRGDWMLWLLGRLPHVDRKQLVLAACECARLSLHLAPDVDDRPRIAIETAEAWARGDGPTLDDVRWSAYSATYAAYTAADAANAAAYAASYAACAAHAAAYAAYAANAVYYAAHAAAANAANAVYYAAHAAAYTAYTAADAAAYADALSVEASTLSHCADIVRTHFPEVPHVQ